MVLSAEDTCYTYYVVKVLTENLNWNHSIV